MSRTIVSLLRLSVVVCAATMLGGSVNAQLMYHGCGPYGSAVSPRAQQFNGLKNRSSEPKDKNIKREITLAALLASGKDANRWSNDSAAEIEGWVFDVKPGGVESVNCGARDLADRDTHIEIVGNLDDAGPTRRLIIEVTPRVRAMAATKGQDWSTEALLGLKGHRVRVTGWMLFDFEHVDEAENTAPRKRDNWRATAWEIHPVTNITVIP
jgi:hypothetical protein